MEKVSDSKINFSSAMHAWEIVQQFSNLPEDDPSLMLDENKIICNPLFAEAVDYIIKHRDEDPEINFYYRAVLETMVAIYPAYYEQEDGSFKKCEPALSFCKDQALPISDILSDQDKRNELTEHLLMQLALERHLTLVKRD